MLDVWGFRQVVILLDILLISIMRKRLCASGLEALIYPVMASLDRSIAHQGCRKRLLDAGESEYSASLENSVTGYMPPVFIVHATDDKDVPVIHSLRYFNSIRDKDIMQKLIFLIREVMDLVYPEKMDIR